MSFGEQEHKFLSEFQLWVIRFIDIYGKNIESSIFEQGMKQEIPWKGNAENFGFEFFNFDLKFNEEI